MARLSMPRRVGLIFLVAFLAGWLGLIAATYVASGPGAAAALPSPERLAALAAALDDGAPAQREAILDAVRSPRFEASIEPGPPAAAAPVPLRPIEEIAIEAYQNALPDRALAVVPRPLEARFPRVYPSAFNAVDFRIGLVTGETLVVSTESRLMVHPNGLPIGFAAALLGLAIALGAMIVLHREFRPLSQLAAAVDTVDPAEMAALPTVRARSPELRALVGAFERLHERIATLIKARLALVGGIQHDLRTFATRLRLRVDKIAEPEERARAERDINDMIALLDDALLASRAGASELDEELVELGPLVAGEVADRSAAGARIDFAPEPKPDPDAADATVLGDRLALRRIVANLAENALKYGEAAHLALRREADELILTVDDEGPGIPPERRAYLLEPFTRLEASRARRTGGAGLGLAVVRSLVEAHGGDLAIEDAPGGGARLIARFPIFEL